MKKLLLLLMAVVLSISISAQKKEQKRVDKETTQWRYELQAAVGQAAEGACLVRVWTYSSKPTIAEGQAGKNAIHGILFKGYPASTDGTRISGREPMISDPRVEQQYQTYFDQFFQSGGAYQRYVSYIGNGVPDAQIKVGKEYKVGITVVVLVDQLRKRLEEDGIIQALKVEGKLPTIMVVPSAMWCNQHGYVLKYDNQGKIETLPDYEKAMMGSPELASTINALNARMAKRGFPLKDLDAALKTVKNESAEESVMKSSMGDAIAESPIDVLRRTAKADIWIEVEWYTTTEKGGSMTSLTFSMNALDAYTDMSVAGVSPTTSKPVYTSSFQLPIMMEAAIQGQFDAFCNSLENYFDKLSKEGRAIKLRVLTWDSFEEGLMAEYDDQELNEIIEEWLEKNTVKGKFGSPEISPSGNRMTVENVRIPVKNAKGRDLDPRTWARGLQKMLRSDYNIESQLSTKGLGQIQLIIGEPGMGATSPRVSGASLTPVVTDPSIPAEAQGVLMNLMRQITTSNDCPALTEGYAITCSMDVLSKEMTASTPALHTVTLAVHFFVIDSQTKKSLAGYTAEVQGSGKTPEKAIISALKEIKSNAPGFKRMMDKAAKQVCTE